MILWRSLQLYHPLASEALKTQLRRIIGMCADFYTAQH